MPSGERKEGAFAIVFLRKKGVNGCGIQKKIGLSYILLPVSHVSPVKPAIQEQPRGLGTQNWFPIQLPSSSDEQIMEHAAPQSLLPQPVKERIVTFQS